MKKLISVAIILVTVFALMVPVFASACEEDSAGVDMWVNCANGKKLNVREAPTKSSRTIVQLVCGTKVHVDYSCGNGWVAVSDYHFSGYVMSEFLVAKKPGKYEITEREDNFVAVNPYVVTAKALNTKTDNSVGLRVKPNKTARMIRRLEAGDQLRVIARGRVWSQVVDLTTGTVGYMANDYMI